MNARIIAPLAVVAVTSCGNDFDPQSKIESVRVLATRADKPYAKPGDVVNLEVLAYDGRPTRPSPMRLFWLPTACVNPPNDDYYACYPAFTNQFPAHTDLTPSLHEGESLAIQVPAGALDGRPPAAGGPPYGTLIAFTMACAGHVEYLGASPAASPEAVPFGCFDAQRARLGANEFVFAFARLFVFADRTNANPVIDHLTFDGVRIDPTTGITMSHCAVADARKCPTKPVDTSVPSASQEPDPSAVGANGTIEKEEIWVDYYLTAGSVKNDLRLLYDPTTGGVSSTADDLTAPQRPAEGEFFAVVHDNRGGVAWLRTPLHVN